MSLFRVSELTIKVVRMSWNSKSRKVARTSGTEAVDTALPSLDDFPDHGVPMERMRHVVAPRSIVALPFRR